MIDAVSSGGMENIQSLMRPGSLSTPAEETEPAVAQGKAEETAETEGEVEDSIEQLLAGKIRNVDEVIHRIADVDPTFQAMIRTRGKIASAYEEMMRNL